MVTNKEQLIRQVQAEFKKQFKSEPKLITLTPGRINIIGEHTDYNEGLAIPTAINRWICGAANKGRDKFFTIHSLLQTSVFIINAKTTNVIYGILNDAPINMINIIKSLPIRKLL